VKRLILLLSLIFCASAFAQPTFDPTTTPLNIKSSDSVVNLYPWQLQVTPGTLTANPDGSAQLSVVSTASAAAVYVPYTGATATVNLNPQHFIASSVEVDGDATVYGDTYARGDMYVYQPGGGRYLKLNSDATTNNITSNAGDIYISPGGPADIQLRVGDVAGANKVSIKNSGGVEIASIDSQGDAVFNGQHFVAGAATGEFNALEMNGNIDLNNNDIVSVDTITSDEVVCAYISSTITGIGIDMTGDPWYFSENFDLGSNDITTLGSLYATNMHATTKLTTQHLLVGSVEASGDIYGNIPAYTPMATYGIHTHPNYVPYYDYPTNQHIVTAATLESGNVVTTGSLTVDTNTLVANAVGYTNKVGVGTATPSVKFHVQSSSEGSFETGTILGIEYTGESYINILAGDANQAAVLFGDGADPNAGGIFYNNNVNSMMFRTAGVANRMFMKSDGKIGVGTNSPEQLFHVSGDLKCNNLYSNHTHPDYITSIDTSKIANAHAVATVAAAGFAPILSNSATDFLNGTGAYSIPGGTAHALTSPFIPTDGDMLYYDGSYPTWNLVPAGQHGQTLTMGFDTYTKLKSTFDGADAATAYWDDIAGAYTFVGTAQLDTAQKKFGTASLLLDGNSDYVTQLDSASWYFGTGNFTIDFWVRFSDSTTDCGLLGQFEDGSNYWYILKNTGTGILDFRFVDGGVAQGSYSSNAWAGLANDTWYHLVFERVGTGAKLFIDGVEQTFNEGTAFGANDVGDISAVLFVGKWSTYYFPGWVDCLRISKGIARWTDNFTPPTSAYGFQPTWE